MKLYGIIGYPLGHSFSKKYFTEKFLQLGITGCIYETFPLPGIRELPALLQQHPGLQGLNVTIPYKQQVIEYLDDASHLPASLPACNCIKINEGKLTGYNTDITGFERSLVPLLQPHHTQALVLGNGGAAAAVKFVLEKLQVSYRVVVRRKETGAGLLYDELDEQIVNEHPLIINTTPLGTFPEADQCPAIPYHLLGKQHLLYDLVYNPEKTRFLQKGEEQGATIKNGYEMLVLQAEESWRIWNEY